MNKTTKCDHQREVITITPDEFVGASESYINFYVAECKKCGTRATADAWKKDAQMTALSNLLHPERDRLNRSTDRG